MSSLYHIRVKGHLASHWFGWFRDLQISNLPDGTAQLEGVISDQAELYGLLITLRDLGLALVSLQRLPDPAS